MNKSKKITINLTEKTQKPKNILPQQYQATQNDTYNGEPRDSESVSRKMSSNSEASKREERDARKENNLKKAFKDVTATIYEQRKKIKFPYELLREVKKENPSFRSLILFEKIITHYFNLLDPLKKLLIPHIPDFPKGLLDRQLQLAKQQKQSKTSELTTMKSVSNEDYSENVLKYYNIELKMRDQQIKRKKNFRQNAINRYGNQINMISGYLIKNCRILNEYIVKDHFQRRVDRLAAENREALAIKQKECDSHRKVLFDNWRKTKQEKYMRIKIKRGEKMEMKRKERKEFSEKYPNLIGVLINPFTIFTAVM